ncbi:MAG: TetR/AcrR family transcriptional regulator [Candidatus Thiodiazotropha sp.]
MSRAGTGITKQQWLKAGIGVLAKHSLRGMKIGVICKNLRITTGSFYHHFKNLEEYQDALLAFYSEEYLEVYTKQARLDDLQDPVDRLKALGKLSLEQEFKNVNCAMRSWGAESPKACEANRKLDARAFEYVCSMFKELGQSESKAKINTYIFLSAAASNIDNTLAGMSEYSILSSVVDELV